MFRHPLFRKWQLRERGLEVIIAQDSTEVKGTKTIRVFNNKEETEITSDGKGVFISTKTSESRKHVRVDSVAIAKAVEEMIEEVKNLIEDGKHEEIAKVIEEIRGRVKNKIEEEEKTIEIVVDSINKLAALLMPLGHEIMKA